MLVHLLLGAALAAPASAAKLRSTAEKAARLKALQAEVAAAAVPVEGLVSRFRKLAAREESEDPADLRSERRAAAEAARVVQRRMRELDSDFSSLRHSYEVDRAMVMAGELLTQGEVSRRHIDMSDAAALDAFQESLRRPQEELGRAGIEEAMAFERSVRRARGRRRWRVVRWVVLAGAAAAAAGVVILRKA